VETAGGQFDLRLPAGGAFRDSLIHQLLNAVELHAGYDRADVDGLVEWRSPAQRAHAGTNFSDPSLSNALLHEKKPTCAADLSLVEPDTIHQAFDRTVEIGVVEHDER